MGPFNYCPYGHCGWDGIVCLSVGSITWSVISSVSLSVSSFQFLWLNLHGRVGIGLLAHYHFDLCSVSSVCLTVGSV